MTKAELARAIAQETEISIKDVNIVLESFFKTVKSQMVKDDKVIIRGFGNFQIKHRAERKARDIRNGTTITIPAADVPVFKPSKQFFDEI